MICKSLANPCPVIAPMRLETVIIRQNKILAFPQFVDIIFAQQRYERISPTSRVINFLGFRGLIVVKTRYLVKMLEIEGIGIGDNRK